jgi:hypothetical protein
MSTESHTVHIGTLNSGVTVGQVAVRTTQMMMKRMNFGSDIGHPAWLDDAYLDRHPGCARASLRGHQGRDRQPSPWSQNVLEQRYVGYRKQSELGEAADDERSIGFTGEFYANDFGTANLDLVAAFFKKYPDYADKTFLSVKVNLISSHIQLHSA